MRSGGAQQLVFLVVLLVGGYLLVVRPQRRRVAGLRATAASLRPGVEVVTAGGLHGRVTAVDGEVVRLEVAPGVEVRVATAAVVRVHDAPDGPSGPPRA